MAEEEDWAVVTVVEVAVDTAVPLLVVLLLALDFGVAARVLLLVIYTRKKKCSLTLHTSM